MIFPLKFNFFLPVTDLAILLVFSIVGFFNFFHVCRLIIDKSDPESSCNLDFFIQDKWT